jgi:hypothetical protein
VLGRRRHRDAEVGQHRLAEGAEARRGAGRGGPLAPRAQRAEEARVEVVERRAARHRIEPGVQARLGVFHRRDAEPALQEVAERAAGRPLEPVAEETRPAAQVEHGPRRGRPRGEGRARALLGRPPRASGNAAWRARRPRPRPAEGRDHQPASLVASAGARHRGGRLAEPRASPGTRARARGRGLEEEPGNVSRLAEVGRRS